MECNHGVLVCSAFARGIENGVRTRNVCLQALVYHRSSVEYQKKSAAGKHNVLTLSLHAGRHSKSCLLNLQKQKIAFLTNSQWEWVTCAKEVFPTKAKVDAQTILKWKDNQVLSPFLPQHLVKWIGTGVEDEGMKKWKAPLRTLMVTRREVPNQGMSVISIWSINTVPIIYWVWMQEAYLKVMWDYMFLKAIMYCSNLEMRLSVHDRWHIISMLYLYGKTRDFYLIQHTNRIKVTWSTKLCLISFGGKALSQWYRTHLCFLCGPPFNQWGFFLNASYCQATYVVHSYTLQKIPATINSCHLYMVRKKDTSLNKGTFKETSIRWLSCSLHVFICHHHYLNIPLFLYSHSRQWRGGCG